VALVEVAAVWANLAVQEYSPAAAYRAAVGHPLSVPVAMVETDSAAEE
jgi:hypothetical protein